jgi:hypothetical protein
VAEFWPLGILRSGSEPRAFLELLRDLGFAMYQVDEDKQRIQRAGIEALLEAYTPKRVYLPTETGLPASQTNIICTRKELVVVSGPAIAVSSPGNDRSEHARRPAGTRAAPSS